MHSITFPTVLALDNADLPKAGKTVGNLQSVLVRLRLEITPSDLARKELGSSTVEAVRAFQHRAGLPADGMLTPDTVARLNAELAHAFVITSRTRTQRLQSLLQQAGQSLEPAEVKSRRFGPSTERALKDFQAVAGVLPDGRITEDVVNKLRASVLSRKLSSKTQVGQLQQTLLRALHIAKLPDVRVDGAELRSRTIGATTKEALRAVQTRYGLPATGELDPATYDRLVSIASSVPQATRKLRPRSAAELKPLKRAARLNMKREDVGDLQAALAFLGYAVEENEFKQKVFGKSTRDAVVSYQRGRGLPITGHAAGETLARINADLRAVNPALAAGQFQYRLRGSVRNELWQGMPGVTIQIWERPVSGEGVKLAERSTTFNGFFDIPYDPPREPATKQIKQPFHLQVKAVGAGNVAIGSKLLFNPTQIAWTNFTQGEYPYRGTSEFDQRMAAVGKAAAPVAVANLVESAAGQQITAAALAVALPAEDVMRLVLSHLVSTRLNHTSIGPAACYAYIAQNLPSTMPGDLIHSTEEWTLIDQLVELAANGLVFMDDDLKALAFDNAIALNLMPIAVGLQKAAMLAALAELKQTYVLEKPILVGNASVKGLLDASAVGEAHYPSVATAFLTHRSFSDDFWADLSARPDDFGGADAVRDFRTTVDVAHVTKNFQPMVAVLKQRLADPGDQTLKSPPDLAKLTHDEWVAAINTNGGQVPPNTDGATPADKVQTYAVTLATESERMFPAVALVATVARSASNPLPHVQGVQSLMDDHPDFDLRTGNLDTFVRERNISVDEDTLTEARVMQRVHRIAPNARAGQALLDNTIHSSSQIVAMGKERFVATVTKNDHVDRRTAMTMFGMAQHQYAQVLQRIADYRFDLHRANPRAIVPYTYARAELPPELAANPNLATLFGSQDFCSCAHCASVYGAPAYLADTLRFLDEHPSEVANRTVQDLLFERRPDIGNIKLNCQNTDTPLPYIDLVCEVLENAVAAPNPSADFSFQTTLTAADLRAAPEHVRHEAYDVLRAADFPLNVAFDLWQEQARVFLQHLGVSRWEVMEAFQSTQPAPPVPTPVSIAGEYWGMSSHETAIVVATADNTDEKQRTYWGFPVDPVPTSLSVADFLRRSALSYDDLLELLQAQWINPPGTPDPVLIERPEATCDLELQRVVNLNVARYDRIHRFLRLKRHLGWATWEIDLSLRAAAVGDGGLDGDCLIHLKELAQVKKRLGVPVDRALALFGDINAEPLVEADRPQQSLPSLYETLFVNRAIVNPLDPAFALPIASGAQLSAHKSTLLAAFALTDADLTLLLTRTANDDLTLANLSILDRYAELAQRRRMRVTDLLTFERLSGIANVFATPRVLLDFIEMLDWAERSKFTADELAYLLTLAPDSPLGLRDEVVTEQVEGIREALRANPGSNPDGVIVSQVATSFALAPDQAQPLLQRTMVGGRTALQVLGDPALVAQDADGAFITVVAPANFPDIYAAFRALHKAARVVQRLALDAVDLEWILTNAATFGLLQPHALPVSVAPATPLFPAWLALAKWVYVRGLFPEPEGMSLRTLVDKAGVAATPLAELEAGIAALTQWEQADVSALIAALGLQHGGATSDFTDIESYVRLYRARRIAVRLGVRPAQVARWARRDDEPTDAQRRVAQEVRQAAKSKYDEQTWLRKVTPLEDALREKKRDALIGFLVANSVTTTSPEIVENAKTYANPAYWQDANDLLKYFLIDVEMSACQLTSRIKQAISSTQMFVQRCLLGLEQPRVEVSRAEQQDTASDNSWRQWRWMKSYRIWEANRKVFLYPENWIEPELRDDKSPFFAELETEILQSDLTDESAEAAFRKYIQKVHDVSRLDIVGAYYELDDTDPRDDLPPDINRLHVIGRTKTQPAVYYYRRFDLNYAEWTPWQKIDLDIQSDQVIPVVYNRKLHLFWLVVIEKPQKVKKLPAAQPSNQPGHAPDPPNQLELQLAWSTYTRDGWTAKRVSHQKLFHPWQRPLHAYNLKPRYKSRENLLWLDVYVSQSVAFNSTLFWDAYRSTRDYVTARHPFDETARPWHSSSFVFDGDVVDVKMKPLAGQYHVLNAFGVPNEFLSATTSLAYVRDNFGEAARGINALSGRYEIAPRLPLPDGMHYQNTRLANNTRTPNRSSANVLEHGQTRTLLGGARSPFEIVHSQHAIVFDTAAWGTVPFFYQDSSRAFFIKPEWQQVMNGYNQTLQTYNYNFYPFYHPYTALFLRELGRSGVEGLLNRHLQIEPHAYYPGNNFDFSSYGPGAMSLPDKTARNERLDFERYGAYALYNWEIFFHAPLLIACRLSQNQRFEEAMRWFHYIFDPTNTESPDVPQRYWITRPFFEQNSDAYRQQRIDNLLKNIDEHKDELRAWKNNPFKPHLIARYRPVAYQKTVVMKYIDNLIAWGDQLFRRDTIEAINEATTLYVLAYELLGRRPVKVPNVEHAEKSYNELVADGGLDPFGNKQIDVLMENFTEAPVRVTRIDSGSEPLPTLNVFYFGIPNNDYLLEYWNRVEDRLFKIRHCMNIQGVVRQLPLFEPPIDPAVLVKAAAAGVDLSSVMADLAVAPAPYRFRTLSQKALELCAEVKALGDKLLSALEKRDGEELALLRSSQEIALQKAVKTLKTQAVTEALHTQASLEQSRALAEQKKAFYESRDFLNTWEGIALALTGTSAAILGPIAVGYSLKGALALVPKVTAGGSGFGGSPHVTADPVDGKNLAESAASALQAVSTIAATLDKLGSIAATMGNYRRRQDDWRFQGELATSEIATIDKQILAAQVRAAIAEQEVENQDLQIEQFETADEFMRSKYTNQQLFDWQAKNVASVYFQGYQLAYDMAKRAEKCFQHERGDPSATFVQFGYWDSLKKGLLAGERLANDIRRMEAAYLEQNSRELEITKNVSLTQHFPLSLVMLKETGACTIVLPEWLFDLDYPGHYFRRLKSVALSIPSVVGPYTSINCTLSLTNHGIRVRTDVAGGYGDPLAGADDRFYKSAVPQSAIATSHGQSDNGMFELNFNDERFLPFEGAGAVSEWRLEMPRENNQFDPATMSDVILHARYTARSSGDAGLIQAAKDNLAAVLPPLGVRMFVINQELSDAWHRFLRPEAGRDQTLSFRVGREHLPFFLRGKANVNVTRVDLVVEGADGVSYTVDLTPPGGAPSANAMDPDPSFGGRQSMSKAGFAPQAALLGEWQLKIQRTGAPDFKSLPPGELQNAYLVLGFKTS